MGEKSAQKKKFILETAKTVFKQKGYKRVTMKDIVEACEISRGGLYLYFDSTEQIFLEVLNAEDRQKDDFFSENITEDATATDILILFLQEQKKELMRTDDTLIQATYEFYFENHSESHKGRKDGTLKRQFESAEIILEKLLEIGVENGEFVCDNCGESARNIMYLIEGMKISAQTMGITSEAVDHQILFILKTLGVSMD